MAVALFWKDECRAIFRNPPAVRLSGFQREIKIRLKKIIALNLQVKVRVPESFGKTLHLQEKVQDP
jgi:hypothetical protein